MARIPLFARKAGEVDLVHLVCFVHLVGFVQPSTRDKPNKPTNGLLMLADFSSVLLVSAGGRIAWSVALGGWGYRRCGRGFRSGLRGLFLFEIDDRGRKCPFFRENGQAERGYHEDGSDDDRELAQEVGGASATKDGLTGAPE